MAKDQRESAITVVVALTISESMPRERLEDVRQFLKEVRLKNWGMFDVMRIKKNLSKIDGEYYAPMVPVDPAVFTRRHPDLRSLLS